MNAFAFVNDTVAYSRSIDLYQYRVLQRVKEYDWMGEFTGWRWTEKAKGPIIDRNVDRLYNCVGLEFIDMGGI